MRPCFFLNGLQSVRGMFNENMEYAPDKLLWSSIALFYSYVIAQ